MKNTLGFTLIELTSCILILVLLWLSMSPLQEHEYFKEDLIINNLTTTIQLARNTAIRTQQSLLLCPNDNNWNNGCAITSLAKNQLFYTIKFKLPLNSNLLLQAFGKQQYTCLTFTKNGLCLNNGTFTLSTQKLIYHVIINKAGRSYIKKAIKS